MNSDKPVKMKHRILKGILFVLLLAVVLVLLNSIVTPDWTYHEEQNNEESTKFRDFYKLTDNTTDYLVMGASQSFYSISPMTVYGETGFTGYDLGSGMQSMALSYYWLKEACKTQHPQVVFLDVHSLIRDPKGSEFILKPLLALKPSLLKLQAIRDCSLKKETAYAALFPLYEFHDRWQELGRNDFIRADESDYFMKGTMINFSASNKYLSPEVSMRENEVISEDPDGSLRSDIEKTGISQEGIKYLEEIISFCDENEMKLVPVICPSKKWNDRWSAMLDNYFKENTELELIDLYSGNPLSMDYDMDTHDNGYHLNYEGNTKVSFFIGEYLKKFKTIKDHRNEEGYEKWDTDYLKYSQWIKGRTLNELFSEESALGYLNSIASRKEELYILFSGAEDITPCLTQKTSDALQAVGLEDIDESAGKQKSFLAAVEGGKLQYVKTSYRRMVFDYTYDDGSGTSHEISLASSGEASGDDSIINVDGKECSCNEEGLNIVVMDRNNGSVLSSANINLDEEGKYVFKIKNGEEKDEFENGILPDGKYTFSIKGKELPLSVKNTGNNCVTLTNPHTGGCFFPHNAGNQPGDRISEGNGIENVMYEWIITGDDDGYRIMSAYNGLYLSCGSGDELILKDYGKADIWKIA